MGTWQLQEAKTHFSDMVRKVRTQGPQQITVRGKVAAVLVSKKMFDKLSKPKLSLVDFMRTSPCIGLKLDLKRNKSTNRDIEL